MGHLSSEFPKSLFSLSSASARFYMVGRSGVSFPILSSSSWFLLSFFSPPEEPLSDLNRLPGLQKEMLELPEFAAWLAPDPLI